MTQKLADSTIYWMSVSDLRQLVTEWQKYCNSFKKQNKQKIIILQKTFLIWECCI